jgi:hypothetical protein
MKRRTLARALTGGHDLGMRGYEAMMAAKKVRRPQIQGSATLKQPNSSLQNIDEIWNRTLGRRP